MQCFYVDRVVHYRRTVLRAFPTVKGWTGKLLKMREAEELSYGMFGKGCVEPRLNKEKLPVAPVVEMERKGDKEAEHVGLNDGKGEDAVDEVAQSLNKLMDAVKGVATAMTTLINRMEETPATIRGTGCFKVVCDAAREVMGLGLEDPGVHADTVANLTQATTEADLNNAEWIEAVDAVMKVVDKRTNISNKTDFPSFSLGVSDDEVR